MTYDITQLKSYTIENARNGDKALIYSSYKGTFIEVLSVTIHPQYTFGAVPYPLCAVYLSNDEEIGGWEHETFLEDGRFTDTRTEPSLFVKPNDV